MYLTKAPKCIQKPRQNNQGIILIVVLWIIVMSLVMVTILASNARLSATTVMHQQEAVTNKAMLMSTLNLAKMQLMIHFSPVGLRASENKKNKLFDGQIVNLSYQLPTDMVVRIYDLSGTIILSHLPRRKFKAILDKLLNQNNTTRNDMMSDNLLDAWQDWVDRDDLIRLHGAEKDYYQQQKPPYLPANSPLESVEELTLIKGFSDVFSSVDITDVFSIYGSSQKLNPNTASKSALLLIPGITEALAEDIIKQRKQLPFKSISQFHNLFSAEKINQIRPWFSLQKSHYFAIIIYPKKRENNAVQDNNGNKRFYVYKELVHYRGSRKIPQTLKVYPMSYYTLPSYLQ
jgi:general secretion pathway protein K